MTGVRGKKSQGWAGRSCGRWHKMVSRGGPRGRSSARPGLRHATAALPLEVTVVPRWRLPGGGRAKMAGERGRGGAGRLRVRE